MGKGMYFTDFLLGRPLRSVRRDSLICPRTGQLDLNEYAQH